MTEDPDLPNSLLMTDEAHVHLHGTINKQNLRYRPAANPYELHQRPSMTQIYSSVCCLVQRSYWTLIPWGWRRTSHHRSQRYTEMTNGFLTSKLPPNHNLWFQQDGAMVHKPVISMAALRRLFPQRVISPFGDVPWPPPPLDLTAPDFFL